MSFEKTFIASELPGKTKGFRAACRGVVIDENGQIPLIFDSCRKYYKLPGGGIEGEENKVEAFKREIMEETGCEIDEIKEIGKVIEKVLDWEQINYCLIGKIIRKGEPNFTQKEIERGYQLKWVSLDEALSLMKDSLHATEYGGDKQERDLFILEKAIEELSKN